MTIVGAFASLGEDFFGEVMMPILDEELPKKKKAHEIGEELAALSLNELEERIELLKGEILRLEAAIKSKRASATAADAFFRR